MSLAPTDERRLTAQPRRRWLVAFAIVASTFVTACPNRTSTGAQHVSDDRAFAARSVLDRALRGMGGVDRLRALRVVERAGTLTSYVDGKQDVGRYRTCVSYPDLVAVEISAGSIQVNEVLGRSGAFVCGADFAVCRPAGPRKTAELRETAERANRELLFERDRWTKIARLEDDGASTTVVVDHGDEPTTYVFDDATGLLKEKARGQRRRRLADYVASGGISIPRDIVDFEGERTLYRIRLDDVRVDAPLSAWCAGIFEKADDD